MVRFSSKWWATLAAVVIVAMVSQAAVAQREQGKRGRGGREGGPGGPGGAGRPVGMAMLAANDKVQDVLKLSDDQKDKIKKVNDETRDEMDKMRKGLDNGDRPDREKMRKVLDSASDKVKEVLNSDQQKRLMGVFIQIMGSGAVMDPAVGKEIDLTDEQKQKLHEAMGPPPEGREGRGDRQSFQDRRAKMDKEVAAVLTAEQQKKLESLKGEKVDIDMSALRGPGGGRERPGRERGKREGAPKEEKSSS